MSIKRVALDEARRLGLRFYFTGIPCKHGHTAKRRTLDRGCVACRSAIDKRNYYKHQAAKVAKTLRWRAENPEKWRAWLVANPERVRASVSKWQKANREWKNAYQRDYAKNNRAQFNAYYRKYYTTKLETRFRQIIASRIRQVLKGEHKSAKTLDLLGCSIEDLKAHLESRFQSGMSWTNYGYGVDKWHIDHIRPCASFDLTDHAQQRLCFNYTNLQPLWQIDNFQKSDTYVS